VDCTGTRRGSAQAAGQAAIPPPSSSGAGCSEGCVNPSGDPMAAVRQIRPELLDSAGHVVEETPLFGGVFWSAYDDTESGTLRYVLGPGRYRLVVHGADGSGFNRELTVP
jgi:hypothetical protein